MTSYSTSFPNTEAPLSESGNWITGTTDGFNSQVDSQTNLAYGTSPTTPPPKDSMTYLSGTWGANQQCQATVYAGTITGQSAPEVELYCRTSMTASALTGYCATFSVKRGSSGYLIIVKLVNATGAGGGINQIVAAYSGSTYDCQNGDVVKMVVVGSTIAAYKNGTLMGSFADTAIASGGAPGFGFNEGGGGPNTTYGISAFSASDGATLPVPVPLQGTSGINAAGGLASLAFTSNVTLGSRMFCTIFFSANSANITLPTVSNDTLGNTWSKVKGVYSQAAADTCGLTLWTALNTKGSGANTMNLSYSGITGLTTSIVIIEEFPASAAGGAADGAGAIQLQSSLATGSQTSSGNFTTTVAGDLLYTAVFNVDNSGTPTGLGPSGFYASQQPYGNIGTGWTVQAAASSSTAGAWTFSDTQSDDLITACAAFKSAASIFSRRGFGPRVGTRQEINF